MAKPMKEEVWLEHRSCGAIFLEAREGSTCPRCGVAPEEGGQLRRHPFKEGSAELPHFLVEHAPQLWVCDVGRVLALIASSSATTTSP